MSDIREHLQVLCPQGTQRRCLSLEGQARLPDAEGDTLRPRAVIWFCVSFRCPPLSDTPADTQGTRPPPRPWLCGTSVPQSHFSLYVEGV